MGIYVCEKCLEEYQLTPTVWTSSSGACGVCGELRGDWSQKFCVYCPIIDRFNLKEELKDEIQNSALHR